MNRSRRWYRATPLILIAACHSETPTVATPSPLATAVMVVAGDQQQADPLDELPTPIVFKVVDGSGLPVKGVTVQFAVPIGGGTVSSATQTSDTAGDVSTVWTMGPQGGQQALQAEIKGVVMATATASTCDPSDCFPNAQLSGTLSAATLLTLATYDGSGQAVHPDVVRGHGGATGFWMAITPYPNGNTNYENPSIFRSKDASNWAPPPGIINPVARPDTEAYLSDPDMIVNNDERLWLYYRAVVNGDNVVRVIQSGDGIAWGAATDVITVPSHQLVSPAVVRAAPGVPWQMWSVNAGPQGCSAPTTTVERRTSNDGIRWSAPITVNLVQPGQAIWHLDVQWVPGRSEYWALYNTYPMGNTCSTNALYLARSPDGINWITYPSPIAVAGVIDAFRHIVYRSTFLTNPAATKVKLWISGAAYDQQTGYTWQTATVTTLVSDLLAIASSPASSMRSAPLYRWLPAPEPDVGPAH